MKVLEHYVSVQGEGPRTGTMTQFIRFAGCNLRCPGWPCDTQHAIEPSLYRGKYDDLSPGQLLSRIQQVREATGAENVCFTGGEPFMQREMDVLLDTMPLEETVHVEVFTNGTLVIPTQWLTKTQINMDWKLSGSGEGQAHHDQRWLNVRSLKLTDMVKFVIKDDKDFDEAVQFTTLFEQYNIAAEIWVGVAFGQMTEAALVQRTMDSAMPWKINVQVHKYIWDPERTLV